MKKLLSILAAVGLTATASTAAVSCSSSSDVKDETISMKATDDVNAFAKNYTDTVKKATEYTKTNSDVAKQIAEKLKIDSTKKSDGKLTPEGDAAVSAYNKLGDEDKKAVEAIAEKAVLPIIKSGDTIALDASRFFTAAKDGKKDSFKMTVKVITLGDLIKASKDAHKATDFVLPAIIFAQKKGTFGLKWVETAEPSSIQSELDATKGKAAWDKASKDVEITVNIAAADKKN